MGNFEFLENINPSLANLAATAEKLFRDEYFDQCITQTRKMAELMTKNVLGSKAEEDDTFDDLLYKLKTISNNNFREQEFISDMYFLKKQGNIAVHSENSSNSGKIALECLEHAFEAAVNYAYALTHNDKINRLIFDEQLLVTGERNTSLQEEYTKKLEEHKQESKRREEEKEEENKKTKSFKEQKILPFVKAIVVLLILAVIFILLGLSAKNTKKEPQNINKPVKTTVSKQKTPVKEHKQTDYSLSKNFSSLKK